MYPGSKKGTEALCISGNSIYTAGEFGTTTYIREFKNPLGIRW